MIISKRVGDDRRIQVKGLEVKTLESLNPRILGPFLPTNWEKNHIFNCPLVPIIAKHVRDPENAKIRFSSAPS